MLSLILIGLLLLICLNNCKIIVSINHMISHTVNTGDIES